MFFSVAESPSSALIRSHLFGAQVEFGALRSHRLGSAGWFCSRTALIQWWAAQLASLSWAWRMQGSVSSQKSFSQE